MKQQSKQWLKKGEPGPIKAKVHFYEGKADGVGIL
jgi:hypothetical protein